MLGPIWRLPRIILRERRSPPGRPRVPESMVMDEPDSVDQFHTGGASLGAMQAVYDLNARALNVLVPQGGHLLDLGVGSGQALHRFLATRPDVRATGVDLSPNMLATARRFLDAEGVGGRVSLVEADITALPDQVTAEKWDAVSCVWCLHHLPGRDVLHAALRQMRQIRDGHGSALWILDFQRLRHPLTFQDVVAAVQPKTPPVLRADGLASEAAAFTNTELRSELAATGLDDLDSGLARPVPWLQAFWCPGRALPSFPAQTSPPARLKGRARVESMLLQKGFSRLPS